MNKPEQLRLAADIIEKGFASFLATALLGKTTWPEWAGITVKLFVPLPPNAPKRSSEPSTFGQTQNHEPLFTLNDGMARSLLLQHWSYLLCLGRHNFFQSTY